MPERANGSPKLEQLIRTKFGTNDHKFTQHLLGYVYGLRANGYILNRYEKFIFNPDLANCMAAKFQAQKMSFFGPTSQNEFYRPSGEMSPKWLKKVFQKEDVSTTINKYRSLDPNLGAQIAFIFGGMLRFYNSNNDITPNEAEVITKSIINNSEITAMGREKSGPAIASAMAMKYISEGYLKVDQSLKNYIYLMSEAISLDPITPSNTVELGLSQVARLRAFQSLREGKGIPAPLPEIDSELKDLNQFPTVGAEFHLPMDAAKNSKTIWDRLAIINMSQYQQDSPIQLCRNDRGVIEIRMNPSIYPVTVANWNHLRLLLPELNRAFFTITINSQNRESFSWMNKNQLGLISDLQRIGALSYAGLRESNPHAKCQEEINFGDTYLGQTVKIHNGKYDFHGDWSYGKGKNGQLGLYFGYGDNLPELAYYLSMVMVKPEILNSVRDQILSKVNNLEDALALSPTERRRVFIAIKNQIDYHPDLHQPSQSGNKIYTNLNPQ